MSASSTRHALSLPYVNTGCGCVHCWLKWVGVPTSTSGEAHLQIKFEEVVLLVMQTHLFVLLQSDHSQPTTGHKVQRHHFWTGGASPPMRRPEEWTDERKEERLDIVQWQVHMWVPQIINYHILFIEKHIPCSKHFQQHYKLVEKKEKYAKLISHSISARSAALTPFEWQYIRVLMVPCGDTFACHSERSI